MSKNKERNESVTVSLLDRFSSYVYKKMPESASARLLVGSEKKYDGLFSKLSDKLKFNKRISLPLKRHIAKGFDGSVILTRLMELINLIPLIQLKCVGVFYFGLGLFNAIAYLIRSNLPGASLDITVFYISVLAAFFGGILSSSQKTCYAAFTESRILSYVAFKLLGLKPNTAYNDADGIGRTAKFFFGGVIGGAVSVFIPPIYVMLAVPVLLVLYALFAFPESGAVALFLSVPFLTSRQLAVFSALLTLSWLVKLLRGKRIFKISFLDITVIIFGISVFFGGVVSVSAKESAELSRVLLSMMAGYFAVSNLIRTPEWIKKCAGAFILSFSLSLAFGIIGWGIRLLPTGRTDILVEILPSGMLSLFSFNSLLIHTAVAILPMILISTLPKRSFNSVLAALIATSGSVFCFIFGESRSALVSALVGAVILLMLVSRRSLTFLIPAAIVVPTVIVLLPSSVTSQLTDLLSLDSAAVAYRQGINDTTLKIISDSFIGGIGLGDAAFAKIYPLYTSATSEAIPHAHGLYSQITVSLGIMGLLSFALTAAALLRRYFSYISLSARDGAEIKAIVISSFTGIISLLIMGTVDYIWFNPSVFLVFWLLLALFSSAVRTAEHERYVRPSDGPSLDIDCETLSTFGKEERK